MDVLLGVVAVVTLGFFKNSKFTLRYRESADLSHRRSLVCVISARCPSLICSLVTIAIENYWTSTYMYYFQSSAVAKFHPPFLELFFAGFSDVLSSMMKRETGSKTLRSERVLSRGDPNFNGKAKLHLCVCVFLPTGRSFLIILDLRRASWPLRKGCNPLYSILHCRSRSSRWPLPYYSPLNN